MVFSTMNVFPKKRISAYTNKELTVFILQLIGTGALLLTVLVAPGLGILFHHFEKANKRERERLIQKIHFLKRYGYIEKKQKNFVLTEKAQNFLNEEEVWNIKPQFPKRWDGEWHIILFDIPGKKERARQALRARLQELGCKPYQNSVYVHKFNVRPMLEKFCAFYGISGNVRFMIAKSIL